MAKRGCRCKAAFEEMPAKSTVPTYNPKTGLVEQIFVIERDHAWRDSWTPRMARQLLLELHSPTSKLFPAGTVGPKMYTCIYCQQKFQKHRFNLHRNHVQCLGEEKRGEKMPSYPNLPLKDQRDFLARLEASTTDTKIAAVFMNIQPITTERKSRKANDESKATSPGPRPRGKRLQRAVLNPPRN